MKLRKGVAPYVDGMAAGDSVFRLYGAYGVASGSWGSGNPHKTRRPFVDRILVGKGEQPVSLLARYGNRHGLVAGATGTGKTVSLMVLAEGFSRMGVPVFMADVKGDVSGLAAAGSANEKLLQRVAEIGVENYASEANPVVFWDVYGKAGHPVRTTISEMGPTLLSRLLKITDTQAGVRNCLQTGY